ncbi:MAG: 5-(carboxyamino)imidazole ribonucleotide synthase [Bacteroidetes bacterium]|nr:5-(carboxyamino)imidazole ribonucleotide synthase [Bacteroidota bacterium]
MNKSVKLPADIRIGVIGGGQLGKMLIEASRPWNVKYTVLENDLHCPASSVADKVILGGLKDAEGIRKLASGCDVLTFEIEHINSDALLEIEESGKTVIPSARALKTIQDKGIQKLFYREHGIPTADFLICDNPSNLAESVKSFAGGKVVIKQCTGGYDGKGVDIVAKTEIEAGVFKSPGPCVVEHFHANITEYSVIVAADRYGNVVAYPLIEMYFNPQSNLVEFLFSPAETTADLEADCRSIAMRAVKALRSPGLFAVELFVNQNAEVLVNEIAPRPHNSGHHTIEGSYTSQFEQLNRILLGLPLGNTDMVQPAAMINLVGGEGQNGFYKLKFTEQLLSEPGVYVHLYNKTEIRPHRKMGHITVMAESLQALLEKAGKVREWAVFE